MTWLCPYQWDIGDVNEKILKDNMTMAICILQGDDEPIEKMKRIMA